MTPPRILLLAGSLRTGSFNRRLAEAAERCIAAAGGDVEHITLRDYPLPIYDADLEEEEGVPETGRRLHARFAEAQGVFIASPEYNAGTPPILKNAIDWVSRVRDQGGQDAAFVRPVFAIASASPGGLGGYRGLMALRQSLTLQLGATVIPQMVSVSRAHEAFEEDGSLKDERSAGFLRTLSARLVKLASAIEPWRD
ncbi:MAG: NAD(P)H-dependent oxidoreductase [Caulobacteraceae bacterium]|nr:NAD(P)H-dependent oxidoreductase [Caulobacteraceae bacterium]